MNTYIVSIVCQKFCQNMGKMLEKAYLSCESAEKVGDAREFGLLCVQVFVEY